MRLLEYESKEIFKKFDIPLLNNIVINRDEDFENKLKNFSFPAIIKSQIAIGSRKKAGLIKIASTLEEAISLCREFFQKEVSGYQVEAILIEELANIQHEYYCSIALDTSGRQFYLLASTEGGIDIEEVAIKNPEAIHRRSFKITEGLSKESAKEIAEKLGFENNDSESAKKIFMKLWEIALNTEALLVEINPLVLTPSGLIAVDGKMEIDDNAVFRHQFLQELQAKKYSEFEKYAKNNNLFFVKLDGEVGILGNGAGLTLELVDILSELGIKPANFLDLGGGARPERVYKALKLIFELNPKAILINIFGGITRCDYIAEGIVKAIKLFETSPPLVIRLIGTKHIEGIEILKKEGMNAFKDLMEAVEKVKQYVN